MGLPAMAALRPRSRGLRRSHRDRSIRARLVFFAFAVTLPLVVFAVLMAVRSYESERARLEEHTREIVRAFTLAVDRELKSKQTAVEALATALPLQSGDMVAFRRQAEAFLAAQPAGSAIVLLDAGGQPVIHTSLPDRAPPAPWSNTGAVRQIFRTAQPWISDLFIGADDRPKVSVDVPVIRDGTVLYALSVRIPLDSLRTLLEEQRLPAGWITSIIDRTGTVVAHSLAPERFVGQPAAPTLREALAAADNGAVSMVTPEGERVIAIFARSPVTGWRAAIGIPQASLGEPLERTLWITAGGGAALLGVAALLAVLMAHRIARPVLSLKRAAFALGRGEEPAEPPAGIREVREVGEAIRAAAARLRKSTAERDRTELALRERDERLQAALLASSTGTYRWDLRSDALEEDDGLRRMKGLPPGQALRDTDDFLDSVHPDDRPAVEAASRRCVTEGADFAMDYRIVRPDGGVRWLADRGKLVRDPEGRALYMTGACTDITGRKSIEERLRGSEERERARAAELAALLEAVPAVVLVAHDPDCRTITGSRATYELLRLPAGSNISKSAAAAQTGHFKVVVDGREASSDELPLQRAARGAEVRGHEEQILFADGCSRHLYGHAIPLRDERGAVRGAVGAFLDITERKRAEERQRLLMAELGHRVNNTLAVVQAIATQTLKRAPSPEAFATALQGRLRALAGTHALLTRGRRQAASLAALVHQALTAHGAQEGTNAVLDGPELSLPPREGVTLGLVLHELATNAAKYGALSTPTGRVEVRWTIEGGEGDGPRNPTRLRLDWREADGPPVAPARTEGFGSGLIRHALAYELGGTATLGFEPDGVRCTIAIPWSDAQPPEPGAPAWAASSAA